LIRIYEPLNFTEQYETVMRKIPAELGLKISTIKLITLDPATILYREEWRDVPQEKVLLTARRLVPNAVAIVTNIRKQFLGFDPEERKRRFDFYGGHAFAYIPYCCLRLERVYKYDNLIEVTQVYHRTGGYQSIRLRLTRRGFESE